MVSERKMGEIDDVPEELPVFFVFGFHEEDTKTGGTSAEVWLVRKLRANGINVETFVADGHKEACNVVESLACREPGFCFMDNIAGYWIGHQGLGIIKAHQSLCLIEHYLFSTEPYQDESWLKKVVPSTCVSLREYEKSLLKQAESFLVFGDKCADLLRSPEFGFGDVQTWVITPPVLTMARRIFNRTKRENVVFVSVGTLSRRKNQLILIRALSELVSRNELETPRLLLIGESEPLYIAELREEMRNCPNVNVEITGPLSLLETHRLVADSDCGLFPSTFESFGMAAVEAACIGIPIISSTQAAPRDMLPESTIWVDSETDQDAWVRALQAWIKSRDHREIVALEKADSILEKRNPEECVRRWISSWRSSIIKKI